jgi:hypothetical protein
MRFGSPSARKWLLLVSAAMLAAGGSLHLIALRQASVAADQSTLSSFFKAALKGLWLNDSLSTLVLAAVLSCIAFRPRLASKQLILLLALIPLSSAVGLFATMGNFYAGYLMLTIAALIVLSGTSMGAPTVDVASPA